MARRCKQLLNKLDFDIFIVWNSPYKVNVLFVECVSETVWERNSILDTHFESCIQIESNENQLKKYSSKPKSITIIEIQLVKKLYFNRYDFSKIWKG